MTRLSTIWSLIEYSDSFIDVGCDHGYTVKYVCENSLAAKITACDISEKSLGKARKLLAGYPQVTFVCADGKSAAKGYETVLVSGLGGDEICSVMSGCEPKTFILSPQSHAREVRVNLIERGYGIVYDKVIRDGKFYDVIKAVRGAANESADEPRLTFGMFADVYNPALADKLRRQLAALATYPETDENLRKVKEIKEVLAWQSR